MCYPLVFLISHAGARVAGWCTRVTHIQQMYTLFAIYEDGFNQAEISAGKIVQMCSSRLLPIHLLHGMNLSSVKYII